MSRPSGTVTFLFTGIEGSTRLWDEHPEAMRAALVRHDQLLRASIAAHGGQVFSTGGDGVAAAFQRAADGVAAALEAQRQLQTEVWPEATPLRVRMGLHTGETQERDGDYFGPPVNRAARVMAAGHGGHIIVSDIVAALVRGTNGLDLIDLGPHRLKGVTDLVHLFGVTADGVEWVDRPLATLDARPKGNLPRPATAWFGPVEALQRQAEELTRRRVITLSGTGGVGKTRTAVEVGWVAADQFPGGVWFVDLAPVADPEMVASTIASAIDAPLQTGLTVVESVVDRLRTNRVLLILDNCEQVIAPVAGFVRAVVDGCPSVTVLATSREPLGVAGERVVPVASLGGPDASGLFCDRARASDASLTFSATDLETIDRICVRLDGIPLAIELAAARARSLRPAELLSRLDDRFRLLRGSGRGGLERHQTLRATVAWSFQLLTEEERIFFARLSVFAGSFDLAAAEAVCADELIDALDVVDLLGSLVDKSMVIADHSSGTTRFRLLDTLRQYGEERIDERDETVQLRDRHLAHYLDVAERAAERRYTVHQAAAFTTFDREWSNLSAAHEWTIASGADGPANALVGATLGVSVIQNRAAHREWVDRTIALSEATSRADVRTYFAAGQWVGTQDNDLDESIRLFTTAIHVADEADPYLPLAWAALGFAVSLRGEVSEAILERLRRAVRETEIEWMKVNVLSSMFDLVFDTDRVAAAEYALEAATIARRLGAPSLLSDAAYNTGWLRLYGEPEPDFVGAAAAFEECARLSRSVGGAEGSALVRLGMIALLRGDADVATRCRLALDVGYDVREWSVILRVAGVVAPWLAGQGRVTEAAALYGYCGAKKYFFYEFIPYRRLWDDGLSAVRADPTARDHLDRGAAMDGPQIVAFMRTALGPAEGTRNAADETDQNFWSDSV